MSTSAPARIFVRLMNEGTDVWRPAEAELQPDGTYLVLGEVPEDETWEYPPGSVVNCEMKAFQNGASALTAVSLKFSWLNAFRDQLSHITDEEWQRRVWFGLDPKYVDSPDGTMSREESRGGLRGDRPAGRVMPMSDEHQDLVDRFKPMLDVGGDISAIAGILKCRRFSKMQSVQFLVNRLGMPVLEATRFIHNSPVWADQKQADKELQDRLADAIEHLPE